MDTVPECFDLQTSPSAFPQSAVRYDGCFIYLGCVGRDRCLLTDGIRLHNLLLIYICPPQVSSGENKIDLRIKTMALGREGCTKHTVLLSPHMSAYAEHLNRNLQLLWASNYHVRYKIMPKWLEPN